MERTGRVRDRVRRGRRFPDDPAKMDGAHVKAVTVTPRSTCTAGNPAREEISNSIGADEHGAIYTVTSAAQYKHVFSGPRSSKRGG